MILIKGNIHRVSKHLVRDCNQISWTTDQGWSAGRDYHRQSMLEHFPSAYHPQLTKHTYFSSLSIRVLFYEARCEYKHVLLIQKAKGGFHSFPSSFKCVTVWLCLVEVKPMWLKCFEIYNFLNWKSGLYIISRYLYSPLNWFAPNFCKRWNNVTRWFLPHRTGLTDQGPMFSPTRPTHQTVKLCVPSSYYFLFLMCLRVFDPSTCGAHSSLHYVGWSERPQRGGCVYRGVILVRLKHTLKMQRDTYHASLFDELWMRHLAHLIKCVTLAPSWRRMQHILNGSLIPIYKVHWRRDLLSICKKCFTAGVCNQIDVIILFHVASNTYHCVISDATTGHIRSMHLFSWHAITNVCIEMWFLSSWALFANISWACRIGYGI